MTTKLLVVDDDKELRDLITRFFTDHGFDVTALPDGTDIKNTMRNNTFDIVLLDVVMPKKDGFQVCKEVRGLSKVPVIMLTSLQEDHDKIVGLELGADDYVTKPFNPRELLARVKAVLRRSDTADPAIQENITYLFEGWALDTRTHQLKDAESVDVVLTSSEYALLEVMVRNAPRVMSRDQLLQATRQRDAGPFDRTIDVQVSRLRQKIEEDPKNPKMIKTIRAGGYAFVVPVKRSH